MKARTCGAVLVLAVAAAASWAQDEALDPAVPGNPWADVAAALAAEAKEFLDADSDAAPTRSAHVKLVQYTPEISTDVARALGAVAGTAQQRQYVAWQLIQPLGRSSNAAIAPMRDTLVRLLQEVRYEPMPTWPDQKIRLLNLPADLPAEVLRMRQAEADKFRVEKDKAERAVVRRNRLAAGVERCAKQLLAMLGDAASDKALLDHLDQEVRGGWATYRDTLSAVKAEVVYMRQPRAKVLYQRIRELGQAGQDKRAFSDPTSPAYNTTGNSAFAAEDAQFIIPAFMLVNQLAVPAQEPAVIIPKPKTDKPPAPPVERPRRPRR